MPTGVCNRRRSRLPAYLCSCWRPALLALLLATSPVLGQHLENRVKAAYLYNFLLFVNWPETAPAADPQTPWRVCVLGETGLAEALQPMAGRRARGRPVELEPLHDTASLAGCQVVFLAASSATRLPDVVAAARGDAVLTVSDAPGFAQRGGMIGFVLHDGRIRIEVNLAAARQAGLEISSKLLEVALRVFK